MTKLSAFSSVALLTSALPSVVEAKSQAAILAEMQREMAAMRAEQQRSNLRIAELESALARNNATQMANAAAISSLASAPTQQSAPPPPKPIAPGFASKLALSGDLRVRYESNFGDAYAASRNRGMLRARLRAAYPINPWLTIGGQIATGDSNDPKTTDITLTRFNNKFALSLDQAYIHAKFGSLQIDAGKIALPFTKTELVWDNDINPSGISAAYTMPLGAGANLRASGMYFVVDENSNGPDSGMLGGQIGLDVMAAKDLKVELAAAYYDYNLKSLGGADTVDFRTNLFANGHYLSDYNLLDVIGAITYSGLGAKWPLRIAADYVRNTRAATNENTGYELDLSFGRTSQSHDWRFNYTYAQADSDAVLAAFSNDNTTIATNYRQHTFSVDYTITPQFILTATYYRYQPLHALHSAIADPRNWLNRLRLNAMVNF